MSIRKISALLAVLALSATPTTLSAAATASATNGTTNGAPRAAADGHKDSADGDRSTPGRYNRVPVIAHRGASRVAPEETLAAYQTAIRQRADVIEGDVQLTKDGHMVLMHDDTLAGTTNVDDVFPGRADARVGAFTLDEIKQLDAGAWFLPELAGAEIPTVTEVLDLVNSRRLGITFELKAAEHSPGVASKLAAELSERGLVDDSRTWRGAYQMMVHSRSKEALRELDKALPELPLLYLTGGPMLADADLEALSTWTMGVFSDPRVTSAADVERAHSFGLEVYTDPVDSPEQMDMALMQGYDHLVTNLPDMAVAVRSGFRDPEPNDNGVVIDHVVANPAGDDMRYEHSEHITLRNTTDRPIDISGHSLTDNGSTRLVVRDSSVIEPGSLFRVYVGDGPAKDDASYSAHPSGILNNTGGDSIVYYDADNEVVDAYSFILPAN